MNRPFRVGISGSYGGLNLGDEAILQVILTELRRSLPEVEFTIFSRNADDTRARHPAARAIPVRELSRGEVQPEVERLDLLIVGGGGILFDAEAALFLREMILAQELGVPTMVYAIGAGPLEKPEAQKVVREALDGTRHVTVRERRALQALEDAGVRRSIDVTADPAFLLELETLPPDTLKREGLDDRHRLIGLSVREPGAAAPDMDEEHYHALLANAADYMVDRLDADLVFVPMERNVLDVQHSHRVIAQMAYANRATVLKGDYTPGQIASLVGHFDFAVGMRLHFLIFAALRRVPFVALPYAGKVMGLLEALEIAAPPMKTVNAGRLIAHIDRSWDQRQDLTDRVTRTLPLLQTRARENTTIAVRLLQSGPAPSEAVARS
jgi:polysaccharide pyruvyl transferase CsaB